MRSLNALRIVRTRFKRAARIKISPTIAGALPWWSYERIKRRTSASTPRQIQNGSFIIKNSITITREKKTLNDLMFCLRLYDHNNNNNWHRDLVYRVRFYFVFRATVEIRKLPLILSSPEKAAVVIFSFCILLSLSLWCNRFPQFASPSSPARPDPSRTKIKSSNSRRRKGTQPYYYYSYFAYNLVEIYVGPTAFPVVVVMYIRITES